MINMTVNDTDIDTMRPSVISISVGIVTVLDKK